MNYNLCSLQDLSSWPTLSRGPGTKIPVVKGSEKHIWVSNSKLQWAWVYPGITTSTWSLFLFLSCQNVTLKKIISVALWTAGTPTWTGLLEEEAFGTPTPFSRRITPSRVNWVSWGQMESLFQDNCFCHLSLHWPDCGLSTEKETERGGWVGTESPGGREE